MSCCCLLLAAAYSVTSKHASQTAAVFAADSETQSRERSFVQTHSQSPQRADSTHPRIILGIRSKRMCVCLCVCWGSSRRRYIYICTIIFARVCICLSISEYKRPWCGVRLNAGTSILCCQWRQNAARPRPRAAYNLHIYVYSTHHAKHNYIYIFAPVTSSSL